MKINTSTNLGLPTNNPSLTAAENESLGDLANRIVDPNFNPELAARKGVGGKNQLDQDAFLKMMLAQIKVQDPFSPLQSHEMASQLAQFASVEQLGKIHKGLDDLKLQYKTQAAFNVMNFLGKKVLARTDTIFRFDEDESHDIHFLLPKKAHKVQVNIVDNAGQVLRRLVVNGPKEGSNHISWDGLDDLGQKVPEGQYRVFIQAWDQDQKPVEVQTQFEGLVNKVSLSAKGPILNVEGQNVSLRDIVSLHLDQPDFQNQSELKGQKSQNSLGFDKSTEKSIKMDLEKSISGKSEK